MSNEFDLFKRVVRNDIKKFITTGNMLRHAVGDHHAVEVHHAVGDHHALQLVSRLCTMVHHMNHCNCSGTDDFDDDVVVVAVDNADGVAEDLLTDHVAAEYSLTEQLVDDNLVVGNSDGDGDSLVLIAQLTLCSM